MVKNNEKGYVILITLLALVLLSVLGIGLITVSSNSIKTSTSERSNQSLFYLAEAGVNFKEAIILNEVNKIYEQEKINVANRVGENDSVFNQNFDTRLSHLLTQNISSKLDESYFINHSNGLPEVNISITQNGTPRKFTIKSEATLTGSNSKRVVERSYEIPTNLLQVITEEVVIPPVGGSPGNTEPEIVAPIPPKDYRTTVANASIEDVWFVGVLKSQQNARFKVSFESTISNRAKILNIGVRDYFTYKQKMPTLPKESISYKAPPSTSVNPATTIDLNAYKIEMTQDLKMAKLPNFSNKVFNIHIPSGERNLVFTDNLFAYNLSSMRFNVTGSGKLNIIFQKKFNLNTSQKFIVNAPNTTVDLIFNDGAEIKGEMIAQDIYIKDRFEPTIYGKLIAKDVYISNGVFDKDLYAQVKINNLYINKGNIIISSPSLRDYMFYANNISISEGNLTLEAGANLNVTDNIFIHNGELNALATTCLQAEQIVVPKDTTRFHDETNFATYYGKKLEMIVSSNINKSRCGGVAVKISPTVPDETPKTKKETHYNFKESDIVDVGNLIEVR